MYGLRKTPKLTCPAKRQSMPSSLHCFIPFSWSFSTSVEKQVSRDNQHPLENAWSYIAADAIPVSAVMPEGESEFSFSKSLISLVEAGSFTGMERSADKIFIRSKIIDQVFFIKYCLDIVSMA
jgi:hypothetical protein